MRVLFDTNIILDVLLTRKAFYESSCKLFELIDSGSFEAYCTASSITDLFYIVRKEVGRNNAVLMLYNERRGCKKKEIKSAIKSLKSVYPDARIIIFGSEANNTATEDSDLDLCVIFPELNKDVFEIAYDIRKIVRKIVDMAVDVIVLDAVSYQSRIKEEWTLEYEISKTGIAV